MFCVSMFTLGKLQMRDSQRYPEKTNHRINDLSGVCLCWFGDSSAAVFGYSGDKQSGILT